MIPWCAKVEMALKAVSSWPPPWVPVETKTPAYLPEGMEFCQEKKRTVSSMPNRSGNLLTSESTSRPEAACGIDECLPLSREVAVTCGDTEEESIVILQLIGGNDCVVGLGGCVHLSEDLIGEGLRDSEELSSAEFTGKSNNTRKQILGHELGG
jgi:hypothetical protein